MRDDALRAECTHTDAEIRELAYQVWLNDQAESVREAVNTELAVAPTPE